VHISARADYALRTMLAIAAADPRRVTTAQLVDAAGVPSGYLQAVLLDLRRGELVYSHPRGADGGYGLARAADAISVGDVLRVTDGTLTSVRGRPTGQATYVGAARGLRGVWLSLDSAIHRVVDHATLADVLAADITT
jgi:Rrf2 family protein